MRDAAKKAVDFTEHRTREHLDTDELLALAVVRLIEIVGEAAKTIGDDTREAHREIPWRQIAGTRDRLAHGYFDVDLDIVWRIITDDLPPLIEHVQQILSEIDEDEDGEDTQ